MNFETLSVEQTKVWIENIKKTISLATALEDYMDKRMTQMDEEYAATYHNGWRKFFYDKDYWISSSGYAYAMGGMRKARHVTSLTYAEVLLRYFVHTYNKGEKTEYDETYERWSKYAKKPFEVHESDIMFYQKMKRFHHEAQELAKKLGMEYEAFNLDEDCKDRS